MNKPFSIILIFKIQIKFKLYNINRNTWLFRFSRPNLNFVFTSTIYINVAGPKSELYWSSKELFVLNIFYNSQNSHTLYDFTFYLTPSQPLLILVLQNWNQNYIGLQKDFLFSLFLRIHRHFMILLYILLQWHLTFLPSRWSTTCIFWAITMHWSSLL